MFSTIMHADFGSPEIKYSLHPPPLMLTTPLTVLLSITPRLAGKRNTNIVIVFVFVPLAIACNVQDNQLN